MKLFEDKILNDIANSILIIIIMWAIYVALTWIIKKIFKVSAKTKLGDKKKILTVVKLVNNVIKYLIIVIALLMILERFGFNTKGLIASLGVAGVIAGLAFKDIVSDFIGGIAIITDNQYEVGDYITIGGFTGSVIEVGMQTTKIKAFNGDVKIISNGNITEVINHSKNPNVVNIDVSTSYDDDTATVEKVLNEVCEEINKNIVYLKSDLKLLGIQDLADSAIVYRLSCEVEPMRGVELSREVNKLIKSHFDANKLVLPYNQLVIHNDN